MSKFTCTTGLVSFTAELFDSSDTILIEDVNLSSSIVADPQAVFDYFYYDEQTYCGQRIVYREPTGRFYELTLDRGVVKFTNMGFHTHGTISEWLFAQSGHDHDKMWKKPIHVGKTRDDS